MKIVNSYVLRVIFQTCRACVFIVPAPGVKDSSLRVCVCMCAEERERQF